MRYGVIDVAHLMNRAKFSAQGEAFDKAGMALHIMFQSLRRLSMDMKVDHMVFCVEGRSWRYSVYPAYKRKRKLDRLSKTTAEKEEDEIFYSVANDFTNYIATQTNCTLLQSEGVEGDDFIARWIQLHPDDEHVILSGDSDFIQLLSDRVCIVDGINERVVRPSGVTDLRGNQYVFGVDPSHGRLKVGDRIDEAERKHNAAERDRKQRLSEEAALAKKEGRSFEVYQKIPFAFTPEPEWWKKALFVKLVRGDTGDGIVSAYPGVRYEGTKAKTGIRQAWEDKDEQGFAWNNFMLQEWSRPNGCQPDGSMLVEQIKVKDAFEFNRTLIDLTCQPDEIKELMDTVIIQAVQKTRVTNVGIYFLKFAKAQQLNRIAGEAPDHARYLNQPYARK